MSKTSAILGAEKERGQMVAQLILCSLAAVCTVGVIWAVGQRSGTNFLTGASPIGNGGDVSENPLSPDTSSARPSKIFTLPEVPPEPSLPAGFSSDSRAPSLGSANLPNSLLPPPSAAVQGGARSFPSPNPAALPPAGSAASPTLGAAPKPILPDSRRITNPQVLEAIEAARLSRLAGDTATALDSLRSADLIEPQHPEILSEMALTHELMGRPEKARPFWQIVQAMGEAQAGGYYGLAKTKLEDAPLQLNATLTSPIQLGNCDVVRDTQPSGGERVTVKVPILATPGAVIDPSQMDIHVFLFEQVNDGERIEQVRADAPHQKWTTDPIDWTAPEGETLEITYDLAAPTPEEMRNLGKRSFHGYIVKLFYQNKIVGEHSHPNNIQDFPPRQAPAGLDNALFPK